MEVVPWRPFREIGSLREELEQIWRRYLTEPLSRVKSDEWTPSLDMAEAEDHVFIEVELPGVEAKDLYALVKGDILTLRGERRERLRPERNTYLTREIYCGPFERSFLLPSGVAGEKVQARFINGILTMTIPKTCNPNPEEVRIRITQTL